MQKRASHRQPLPHPARKFPHQPVAHAVKAGALQPFHGRNPRIRNSIQPPKQTQILKSRQLFVNSDAVPQHANSSASAFSPSIAAENRNTPLSRLRQPRQHPQQRSLPCPIAPNQSKASPALDIETDIRKSGKVPKEFPDTIDRDRSHFVLGHG